MSVRQGTREQWLTVVSDAVYNLIIKYDTQPNTPAKFGEFKSDMANLSQDDRSEFLIWLAWDNAHKNN
jgi:hypothetical protein